jgi:hypothetical protein
MEPAFWAEEIDKMSIQQLRNKLKTVLFNSYKETVWTNRKGEKVDIDTMSLEYLRNTLKMVARNINRQAFAKHQRELRDDWYYKPD